MESVKVHLIEEEVQYHHWTESLKVQHVESRIAPVNRIIESATIEEEVKFHQWTESSKVEYVKEDVRFHPVNRVVENATWEEFKFHSWMKSLKEQYVERRVPTVNGVDESATYWGERQVPRVNGVVEIPTWKKSSSSTSERSRRKCKL